jgi:hypothetical protein
MLLFRLISHGASHESAPVLNLTSSIHSTSSCCCSVSVVGIKTEHCLFSECHKCQDENTHVAPGRTKRPTKVSGIREAVMLK